MSDTETQPAARLALENLMLTIRELSPVRGLPEGSAVSRVLAQWGNPEPGRRPDEERMEIARRNVLAAASQGYTTLSPRDYKLTPWLLWEGDKGLAELPGLTEAVCAAASTNPAALRALFEAWIASCNLTRPSFGDYSERLRRLLAQSGDVQLELWRSAQRRFALFDIRRGPQSVAAEILDHADTVAVILAAAGLDREMRTRSGYVRLVQSALVSQLPKQLAGARGGIVFARAQRFFLIERKFRFDEPRAIGALATALLVPWRRGAPLAKADGVKDEVLTFLLDRLGDPRTKPINWREVEDDAADVMRSWLTRKSLELFFDVIADHADVMFAYRRAFWNAFLQAGHIDDAWLALGSSVSADAGRIKELRGGFGRIRGASANQSVLLIRIGSTVFCEWSHAGSLRAWPADASNAPQLGLREYSRNEVVQEGLSFPANPHTGRGGSPDGKGLRHFTGADGYWQASAAELIARRCGIRLAAKDWMPK